VPLALRAALSSRRSAVTVKSTDVRWRRTVRRTPEVRCALRFIRRESDVAAACDARNNVPMANRGGSVRQLDDSQLAERLQSILINAAAGRRNVSDDSQYNTLRRELMRRHSQVPSFLRTHPSVDSFTASIKGVPNKPEREEKVRNDFSALMRALKDEVPLIDSSTWTGETSPGARLQTVRTLLPLARTAVDSLIATLSEPNANGGPLLDGREEAIEHLRNLHRTLGELLNVVDSGHLDDGLGERLQVEAAGYAKRAARALRDDPAPYLSAALLLGIFYACGIPDVGGFLGGVALTVKKHAGDRAF